MSIALKLSTGFALALLFLMPTFAHAAEPTLSVKLHDDGRTLMVKYRNLPKSTLTITDANGEAIRTPVAMRNKNGTKKVRLPKDLGIGTYTAALAAGDQHVQATFSVAHLEVPVCKLRASEKVVERGDIITLRWTSKNADTVTLFEGRSTKTHGSERVSLHHLGAHGYVAKAVGKGGVSTCSATVRVK